MGRLLMTSCRRHSQLAKLSRRRKILEHARGLLGSYSKKLRSSVIMTVLVQLRQKEMKLLSSARVRTQGKRDRHVKMRQNRPLKQTKVSVNKIDHLETSE